MGATLLSLVTEFVCLMFLDSTSEPSSAQFLHWIMETKLEGAGIYKSLYLLNENERSCKYFQKLS